MHVCAIKRSRYHWDRFIPAISDALACGYLTSESKRFVSFFAEEVVPEEVAGRSQPDRQPQGGMQQDIFGGGAMCDVSATSATERQTKTSFPLLGFVAGRQTAVHKQL